MLAPSSPTLSLGLRLKTRGAVLENNAGTLNFLYRCKCNHCERLCQYAAPCHCHGMVPVKMWVYLRPRPVGLREPA